MTSIPVLAKAGAIIPLCGEYGINDWKNPENLELLIYRGNGSYEMYEDDGETNAYKDGHFAKTKFTVSENAGTLTFTVGAVSGDNEVVPEKRTYTFSFKDITDASSIKVTVNGRERKFATSKAGGTVSVTVEGVKPKDKVEVVLEGIATLMNPPKQELIADLLSKVQGFNTIKSIYYAGCHKKGFKGRFIPDKSIKAHVDELEALE